MLDEIPRILGFVIGSFLGILTHWDGWLLIAIGAILGWRRWPWWTPLPIGIGPYAIGFIVTLGHHNTLSTTQAVAVASYVFLQIAVAYLGYFLGCWIRRRLKDR